MVARRDTVASLDIGTTKVSVIVAELRPDGSTDIIGVGTSPSTGLRKGVVVDIDRTSKSIGDAVTLASRMAGVDVKSVFVGVAGGHIACLNNRGVVAVSREDREITPADVDRVMDAARVINLAADREIIHVLPRQFIVDGYDGIRDPAGMVGIRLEVEAHIVTGATTALQNTLRSVHRAGLEAEEVVLAPLAAGDAVLLPDERDLGVVLVDIGGGTTDIAIYDQGSLWHTTVIPAGGDYVTNDIAVGLRTPIPQAEAIKCRHGLALAELASDDVLIDIPSVGGSKESRQVSQRVLASIIEARLEEIALLVGRQMKAVAANRSLPGGVVLTGGASQMEGFDRLMARLLDMPVRVGIPDGMGGLQDIVRTPPHAVGVGLIRYAVRFREEAGHRPSASLGGLFGRLRDWFGDLF